MTDKKTQDASSASRLSGKLCPQEPIYKDGEVPTAICINHKYASNADLKTGASWRECIYCGKKKNY